jgi:tetratricopeptide (TPR) repeat protein
MQNSPPAPANQGLLEAAQAQLDAGNLEQAISLAQQALALDPQNGMILNALAVLTLRVGNLDAAERYARQATQIKPAVAFVVTLADVMRAKEGLEEAAKYYHLVLKRLPNEYQALYGLAQIYEQTGHRSLAVDYYERALMVQPHDTALFHRFTKIIVFAEAPRVYAALQRATPNSDSFAAQLNHLINLARWKEYATRAEQGLQPHARSPSDLFFTFASSIRDDLEAMLDRAIVPENLAKMSEWKAMCMLARGARKESEEYYKIRAENKPNSLYENIVFNDDFYLSLEKRSDEDLFGSLPPVTEAVSANFEDKPIIFLSCDLNYYHKFAQALLLSINDIATVPQVHMHIMDAGPEHFAALRAFSKRLQRTKIAVTVENTGSLAKGIDAAKCYYHAIRFIRLYQHAKRYNKTLWQMDVDGLMYRDLAPIFDSINTSDIALWGAPGRWEAWSQFNASLMGIRPTEKGFAYLRLVAAYIGHFYKLDKLRWGIDQLAMFGVHEFLKDQGRGPSVAMIPSHAIDGEYTEQGLIWSNGGGGKFNPLKLSAAIADTPPDSPRIRYAEYFKRYSDKLEQGH